MPTPASPAGTWCNHTLERKRSTLGRSSGEAFGLAAVSYAALSEPKEGILMQERLTTAGYFAGMVVSLIFRG